VGTIGISGSFSFQEAKVMTAGEGGMIITNNRELAEIARSYINCGRIPAGSRTRRRVLGSNGRMTEFQAALLLAQLKDLRKNTFLRMKNTRRLTDGIKKLRGIRAQLPPVQATKQAYYFYTFRLIKKEAGISRDLFIKALNAEGIPTRNTFVPLYRDPLFHLNKFDAPAAFRHFKAHKPFPKDFPMAEKISAEIVALWHPLLTGSSADIDDIVSAIKKVITQASSLNGIQL
jgi:dTDP-4-amino-4,6-dideoxygalactose transaminase